MPAKLPYQGFLNCDFWSVLTYPHPPPVSHHLIFQRGFTFWLKANIQIPLER